MSKRVGTARRLLETAMTVRDFEDLLTSKPFQPFRVVVSSGEAYDVRHPEMAWLTRTNLFVRIDADSEGVPGRAKVCSLLHVTTVEPLGVDEVTLISEAALGDWNSPEENAAWSYLNGVPGAGGKT